MLKLVIRINVSFPVEAEGGISLISIVWDTCSYCWQYICLLYLVDRLGTGWREVVLIAAVISLAFLFFFFIFYFYSFYFLCCILCLLCGHTPFGILLYFALVPINVVFSYNFFCFWFSFRNLVLIYICMYVCIFIYLFIYWNLVLIYSWCRMALGSLVEEIW